MDTITFEIGDYTIQLVGDRMLFWVGVPDKDAVIDIDIATIQNALITARMLVK